LVAVLSSRPAGARDDLSFVAPLRCFAFPMALVIFLVFIFSAAVRVVACWYVRLDEGWMDG